MQPVRVVCGCSPQSGAVVEQSFTWASDGRPGARDAQCRNGIARARH
jgi:hypothetical protein